MTFKIPEKFRIVPGFLCKYWLLVFFIAEIAYLELIFRLWIFKGIDGDFVFPLIFSVSAGAVLFFISGVFPVTAGMIISLVLTFLTILIYCVQLVYYSIFKTPLMLFSITGAGEVLEFRSVIITAVINNGIGIITLFVPLAALLFLGSKLSFFRIRARALIFTVVFCIAGYGFSILCVNITRDRAFSQYELYYKAAIPELSVDKLGLLTTMRLDLKRLVFGFQQDDGDLEASINKDDTVSCITEEYTATPDAGDAGQQKNGEQKPEPTPTVEAPIMENNEMDIDFASLIANEKDANLMDMHKYFSNVKPTLKNKYTGLFKGCNLILITAESFSTYAISPQLTPTLYKMSKEGFVFNNFYNPVWGVSTSDGEYVACTGLIPKSGIWSFAASGKNYMPFVMGNQLGKLGYTTKAYHNHSYKYYKRDISHPNMGYDYKGVGNGLKISNTWPESDLEMIEVTAGEYINSQPFHTYYMTVSGHLNYSYTGNFIARKNKDYVSSLPYSEPAKAYIACNLELEFAMKSLMEKLEAAGVADNTVIAISPDHYPYGLPKKNIDELAGHTVESNFELYKSTFILWKKGMDPVIVDKPCSSLDIIPTLSNLFGLEFDSRLLMGSDILSETSPLVIFSNRSWITDRAMYNTQTGKVVFTDGTKEDKAYVTAMNKTVADKFKYSAKILETDYYRKVVKKD